MDTPALDVADDTGVEHAATQPCPACGEEIRQAAKKCRFCGHFLDAALERRRRRRGQQPKVDSLEGLSSLLILLGIPGFAVCFGHVCMAGHWDHPPYPAWHTLSDAAWPLLFLGGGLAAGFSRTAWTLRALPLVAVVVSRLGMGSAGGGFWIFETPVVGALAILSVVSLGRWLLSRPWRALAD